MCVHPIQPRLRIRIWNCLQLLEIMPNVGWLLGVLACWLLVPMSVAYYNPRPIAFVGGHRLVIYHGPTKDCEIAADPLTVNRYRNVSRTVSASKMAKLVERCQEVHARLYARNPAIVEERRDVVEDNDSANSLWSLNMFNRILIFPGTKWCGQGSVAEHIFDLGFHSEADRCCR